MRTVLWETYSSLICERFAAEFLALCAFLVLAPVHSEFGRRFAYPLAWFPMLRSPIWYTFYKGGGAFVSTCAFSRHHRIPGLLVLSIKVKQEFKQQERMFILIYKEIASSKKGGASAPKAPPLDPVFYGLTFF